MTPAQARAIRQHKAWLLVYIQEIRPANYLDMRTRIERQVFELCEEFEKVLHDHAQA